MKKLICILCMLVVCNVCIHANNNDKRYNLYKTDNMYTFLKLDTRTGQIWQVHWSTKKDGRASLPLSTEKLSSDNKDGRFILLDTIDGRTWQVQWSFKEEERMIVPIKLPDNDIENQPPSSWDDSLLRQNQ